jgi:UPF0755 protein
VKWLALLISAVLSVAVVGLVVAWQQLTAFLDTPADPSAAEKTVMVPDGATPLELAALFEKESLTVADPWMQRYAEHLRLPLPIKGGEYALSGSMTPVQQFDRVESAKVVTYTITIPGGATAQEVIADLVEKKLGEEAELTALVRDPAFLESLHLPGETLEGYLIADTYTAPRGLPAKALLKRFVDRYHEIVGPEAIEKARSRQLSEDQQMVVASLVEKADVLPDERRHYAALIYNRLSAKMPLESPAADAYGEGREPPILSAKGKPKAHRWSTKTRLGLPATPICSPSPAAIEATLAPAPTRAIYIVTREDRTHVFCEDIECYLAESARWHREVPPNFPRPPL